MLKSGCPEVIKNCLPFFQKLVDPQFRDSLLTDMRALSANIMNSNEDEADTVIWNTRTTRTFPKEVVDAFPQLLLGLPSSRAQFLSTIIIHGFAYSVSSKHMGNSCVSISTKIGLKPHPARIAHIFRILRGNAVQTYIAVRRHLPAAGVDDPYSRFPVLGAQLWDACLGNLEIIDPSQIECHFACLDLHRSGRKLVVALPLSRVRFYHYLVLSPLTHCK